MLMGCADFKAICRRQPDGSFKAADCRIREELLKRMITADNEHGLAPATAGATAV